MITKYNTYNESVRDTNEVGLIRSMMKPKSEEEIRKSLKNLSTSDKLMLACQEGLLWLVKEIIDEEDDVDFESGLCWSSEYGHTDIVKLMIEYDADVQDTDDYALVHASEGGYTDIVKILLNHGANIHVDNDRSLVLASENGHTDTVKLLLDFGADINVDNNAPIRKSTVSGHIDTVKLLLDRGAKFTITNKNTPWFIKTHLPRMFELLKKYGQINESVRDMMKPKSEEEIRNFLNSKTPNEKLLIGVKNDTLWLVEEALKEGADINVTDKDGFSVLMCASLEGHLKIIKYLIENGADVNYNRDGWTSLMYASVKGNFEVVKYLVESGADVHCKDVGGFTALKWAKLNNNLNIINYLEQFEKTNESVRDMMKPKSKEDILKSLEGLSPLVKLNKIFRFEPLREVFSDEEIKELLEELVPNNKFVVINANNLSYLFTDDELIELFKEIDLDKMYDYKLVFAVQSNRPNLVKFLLDEIGSDVNCPLEAIDRKEYLGITYTNNILEYSCFRGYTEIVKILLERGAKINNNVRKTILGGTKSINIIDRLKETGNNETAKLLQQYSKTNESVRDMMKPKSEEDIRKSLPYMTPAHKLIKGCLNDVLWLVEEAIAEGMDVHTKFRKDEDWAIRTSVSHENLEITECLLKAGANIHIHNEVLLSNATFLNNIELVKLLVKYGANVYTKFVDMARTKGFIEIEDYLESFL